MRFYLLNIIQIGLAFFICLYITIKFTFGESGILKYYELKEKFKSNQISLNFVKEENKKLSIKSDLLNERLVNSLYLEELARTRLQFGTKDEKLIILNNEN